MTKPGSSRSVTGGRGFKSRRPDSVRVSAGHRPLGTVFPLLGMNAWSSTPLLDPLTRAGCHATTGSSEAHRRVVPDVGQVSAGLGSVAAVGEPSGDDAVQLSPRGGAVGAVPGGVLAGSGRRRGGRRSVRGGPGACGGVPGVD